MFSGDNSCVRLICGASRLIQGAAAHVVDAVALVDHPPPLGRAVVDLLVRFERLLPLFRRLPREGIRRGRDRLHRDLIDGSACLVDSIVGPRLGGINARSRHWNLRFACGSLVPVAAITRTSNGPRRVTACNCKVPTACYRTGRGNDGHPGLPCPYICQPVGVAVCQTVRVAVGARGLIN